MRSGTHVRDLRVYIVKSRQKLGYGFLVQSFVKAYFFPWASAAAALASVAPFELPLGGAHHADTLALMPSGVALTFYKGCGFDRGLTTNTVCFTPAQREPLSTKAELKRHFGLVDAN